MEINNLEQIVTELFEKTPENITGVGYGFKTKNGLLTDQKSIVFNVDKKIPTWELNPEDLIPETITISGETFTTDVTENEAYMLSCPSSFYTWENAATPPSNRNKFRPMKGGISCTNSSYLADSTGTLGFFAVCNETNYLVAVSNNHVLVRDAFINLGKNPYRYVFAKSINNNGWAQPAEAGVPFFISGEIKRYKPIYERPTLNRADVALATVKQSDINLNTSYLIEGLTGWTQPLQFASSSEIDSLLNNQNNLFSAGRTTGAKGEGPTKLRVSQYPVTIKIKYKRQDIDKNVNFERCIQFIASASTTPTGQICPWPGAPGDSGSALIADFGGVRKIVGLVFAGSGPLNDGKSYYGFANRIDDVAQAINISAWTGQTVNLSNNTVKQTHIVPGMSSTEKLVINGNTFWQAGIN